MNDLNCIKQLGQAAAMQLNNQNVEPGISVDFNCGENKGSEGYWWSVTVEGGGMKQRYTFDFPANFLDDNDSALSQGFNMAIGDCIREFLNAS